MSTSLASQSLSSLLAAIAAKTPTPGGGAVASVVGALGAALGQMVVSYSIGKKALSGHQEELLAADRALTNARRVLVELGDEDAAAYGLVNELSRLPETDERRRREYAGACEAAALVPMAVMGACADVLRLFERLGTITNPQLRSDLGIAAVLAEAAIRASRWNVLVNTPALAAERGARLMEQAAALEREAGERRARVEGLCGRA